MCTFCVRVCGCVSSQLIKDARARDMRLSECRDIDPPFPGAEISCMAIDEVEDRYAGRVFDPLAASWY